MKTELSNLELEDLLNSAMELRKRRARENDVLSVSRLSNLSAQIMRLQDQHASFRAEVQGLKNELKALDQPSRPPITPAEVVIPSFEPKVGSKAPGKKLSVKLDWTKIGKPWGAEVISEHMAAATLQNVLKRISTVLGETILEKLCSLRVNRGPLVSKHPERDFVKQSSDEVYAYHRIPQTDYYVLTHSGTAEKVEALRKLSRFLQLPLGFITANEVEK